MTTIGGLILAACLQDDALWRYGSGESAQRPDLTGLDWKQVRNRLDEVKFAPPDAAGRESSHTHKLSNGHEATFYYYVPESYDPAKPAPLAIFLHGGVSDRTTRRGKGQWQVWKAEADRDGWIVCAPSGTGDCLWWHSSGEEHILEAIRFLSARFNLDRNRVFVSGFSDGASGVYCLGMRLTDVWAACIPWNGAIGVVTSPRAGNTPYYALNCRGTSWRATHGGKDQLYPSAGQKPVIERLKQAGVDIEWKDFEDIGHEGGKIIRGDREFVVGWIAHRRRDPMPKEIDWTLHDPRYGQAFWIRVLEIADRPGNPFEGEKSFVFPIGDAGPPRPVLGVQLDQAFEGPGVRVEQVSEGSGAAEAGVKPGDVITSAGGAEVKTLDDLRGALGKLKSGDRVKLTLARRDERIELEVAFRPVTAPEAEAPAPPARIRATRDGNSVQVLAHRVASFEILVSPDGFDLAQEIVVTVNGGAPVKRVVKPEATLMLEEMLRRHGDRSVCYVGRIRIDIPRDEREY
jgi:predicted esterase